MKKLSLIIAAALIVMSANAQRPLKKGNKKDISTVEHLETKLKQLDEIVQLSDVQENQIREFNTQLSQQLNELKGKKDEESKAARKELIKNHKKNIKSILTAEQTETLKIHKKEQKKKRDELKKALSEYKKSNIDPIMSEKRLAFDKNLSEDEKNTISEVKQRLNEMKESMKNRDDEEFDPEAMKNERKELMNKLKPIAQNHKEELKSVLEDIKPQSEQWKKNIKALKEKHKGTTSIDEEMLDEEKEEAELKNDKSKKAQMKKAQKGAYRFLLFEPEA